MDGRGWGLALESDHHLHQQQQHRSFVSGSNNLNKMKFQSIEFPVNLNRRSNTSAVHEDEHEDNMNSNKKVVGEVDFFSSHNNHNYNHNHNKDDDNKCGNIIRPSPVHHQRLGVKEEISPRDHQLHQPAANVNTGLHLLTTNTGSDQSTIDDGASSDAEDKRAKNELAVLQVELERMNAENQKLRSVLSQVNHNYNSLQMHLVALMQQQQLQKGETSQQNEVVQGGKGHHEEKKEIVPRQFLDLGPSANNETTTDEMTSQTLSDEERMHDRSGSPTNNAEVLSRNNNNNNNNEVGPYDHGKGIIREDSPDESEAQGWGANKVPKLNPPMNKGNTPVDQAATEATMRKARVSVRARSEAPMISDGCQWRKYGQKMAKGNPCPRAYYRCTMAVGCPVRKQVQRCAEDRTILITTYEGNHNHPLPPAAMAMASTTSAAASMLLSGSMPSGDGLMNPNFLARTILPCSSSMATISASAPFPTVTLDLTHSPNPLQFQRPPQAPPQPHPFQVPFPPSNSQIAPHFMASMPQIFGQALLNHNNQSKFSGLHSSSPNAGQFQVPGQNPGLADSISAATAAIASDPNFTAALVAAISSIFGGARPADNAGPTSSGATTSGNNNHNNNNSNNNNVVNSSSSMQQ